MGRPLRGQAPASFKTEHSQSSSSPLAPTELFQHWEREEQAPAHTHTHTHTCTQSLRMHTHWEPWGSRSLPCHQGGDSEPWGPVGRKRGWMS